MYDDHEEEIDSSSAVGFTTSSNKLTALVKSIEEMLLMLDSNK